MIPSPITYLTQARHISDVARKEIAARDWSAMHLAGDRNPPIKLSFRPWRKTGDGSRRERGGHRG